MKRGIILVVIVLLGLLVLPLSNLMLDRTPDPELTARIHDPDLMASMPVLMASCTDCHTQQTRKPIYMKIPPASGLIAGHIEEAGERPIICLFTSTDADVETINGHLRDAGLSNLTRIRKVIQIDDMPLLGTGKTNYRELTLRLKATVS